MTSKKNSFLLRISSYTREIDSLSLSELGLMFKAIYAHAGAEHATMPELSPLLRMALSPIFAEMDRAVAEYDAVCRKRAEGGKLGGRPKTKRLDSEPQGIKNNLKVAQGALRVDKGRQGALSNQKNPEYEYEYDTTTAKDNILTTTKLCSIDRETGNLKVPLASLRGHEQPKAPLSNDSNPFGYDDQPPPDYDPAAEEEEPYFCSFDIEQEMALHEQDERSDEDSPF